MATIDPTREEYLAVVSEWQSYSGGGGLLGNAFPLFCLSRNEVVTDPLTLFPNPGYVFLLSRGELSAWDIVRLSPRSNTKYQNQSPRECYYLCHGTPVLLTPATTPTTCAVLLDVPSFLPEKPGFQINDPAHNVTPVFFVRNASGTVFGPLLRSQVVRTEYDNLKTIIWRCFSDEGVLFEWNANDLASRAIKEVVYEHPEPDVNPVIRKPIRFLVGPVHNLTSRIVHDKLTDEELAAWYLRVHGIADAPLQEFAKFFSASVNAVAASTPEFICRRFQRLQHLLPYYEALQSEQRSIVRSYVNSPEGQKRLSEELGRHIEQRAGEIDEEVKHRKATLFQERERQEAEFRKLENTYKEKAVQLAQACRTLQEQQNELQGAVAITEAKLHESVDALAIKVRENIPLLAAITGGLRAGPTILQPSVGARSDTPNKAWSDVATISPTRDIGTTISEAILVDHLVSHLRSRGLGFTRDFVANLLVCLKSSALNLITGPPGLGKSSVVAELSDALGHGDALLEVCVRRSWSDDRYLLGFYDVFHGRYEPGPTGLATRLLQAQRDWESGGRGIYFVLLEEFNLAAPEYYFSQLMQLVTRERADKRLRLFDPAMTGFAEDVVTDINLTPNARFWGTINYDETTERLSPRMLDRTGMIFLGSRDISPSSTPDETSPTTSSKAVSARDLLQDKVRRPEECSDECWSQIEPLLAHVRQHSDEWGPGITLSPRVLNAIRRYLANSDGVLSVARAIDFAFQQRVLPLIRGRGPEFEKRIAVLLELLEPRGCERSARHIRESLALAKATFGELDLFAY